MRADAHLAAARAHDARAAELARWPAMQRDAAGFDDPAGGLWYRRWDSTEDETRLAQHHRTEASRLQARFDDACANVSGAERSVSPLQRFGLGGFPSDHGVTVMLASQAGPPDRLMAAMHCHRAWMMLGEAGMEDCPLDLDGLAIETYGDETGISVEITVRNRALVPELQRRAAKDLERSMANAAVTPAP
jgi:hypothetical protein